MYNVRFYTYQILFDYIIMKILMFTSIKSLEDVNSMRYVDKQWAISCV